MPRVLLVLLPLLLAADGLGAQPPTPEWGLMLSGGRNVIGQAWWVSAFPGAAITITVVAATMVGRILRARAEGVR